MLRYFALTLLTCAMIVASTACNSKAAPKTDKALRIKVVATTCLIKDLVQNLGGNRVDVESIVPCEVDPRVYAPTTVDSEKITKAQLVFHNGLNWEANLVEILKKQRDAERKVFSVSAGAPIDRLGAIPGELGEYDPHIWFNVTLWKYATETVKNRLSDFDKGSKAEYEKNADKYLHELDTLDEYIRQNIRLVPQKQRMIVSTHTALSYFAKDYRLEFRQIPLQKMDAAQLKELADLIVERDIPAIFIDQDHPRESVQQLVKAVEARGRKLLVDANVVFDVLGESGTETGDYMGIMKHNVDIIVGVLYPTKSKT